MLLGVALFPGLMSANFPLLMAIPRQNEYMVPRFCWQQVLHHFTPCFDPYYSSLIPRLSRNANMYRVESLVSFVRKHDIIKIGQKQKGNVCALFNQLHFNARCV